MYASAHAKVKSYCNYYVVESQTGSFWRDVFDDFFT